MAHKKPNLPEKVCAACSRPFTWRKKWAKTWDERAAARAGGGKGA